jgi:hypothetical protein
MVTGRVDLVANPRGSAPEHRVVTSRMPASELRDQLEELFAEMSSVAASSGDASSRPRTPPSELL